MKRARGQSGFSLVEIMVAVGVIAIISAAISSMVSNMYDMENRFRVTQDGRSLQYELEQITKKDLCGIVDLDLKTISNANYDANLSYVFNNTEAISGLGLTLKSDSSYGMLDIIRIQIEPWMNKSNIINNTYEYKYVVADQPPSATASAAARVKAQLKITYIKKGQRAAVGTADEPTRYFAIQPIFLVKNPADPNKIIDCYTVEVEEIQKGMCESLGGEWDTASTPPSCKVTTADSGNSFNCLQTDSCGVVSRYIQ